MGVQARSSTARQRLVLLGMPPSTIAAVERSGRPHTVITIASPIAGTIKSLGVRPGMSVMAGQTLAEINGLGTVWLRSAEHTSALQSLMRSSYAVFCLNKKNKSMITEQTVE